MNLVDRFGETPTMWGNAQSGNRCLFTLAADFDIDKGSTLTHQCPQDTGIDPQILAALMLPDGVHEREMDWTMFVLNQCAGHAIHFPQGSTPSNDVIFGFSLVCTSRASTAKRGAVCRAIAVLVNTPYFYAMRPLIQYAFQEYHSVLTEATNSKRGGKPIHELGGIVLSNLRASINAILWADTQDLSLKERLLIRIAPVAHIYTTNRIRAQSLQLGVQDDSSIEGDSDSSSLMSLSSASQLPDETLKPQQDDDLSLHRAYYAQVQALYSKVDESSTLIDLHVPRFTLPNEVGHYSVADLLKRLLGNKTREDTAGKGPLYSSGATTSNIVLLINAILMEKRVIILGHGLPAETVAMCVFAACAMATGCGLFPSNILKRAFPYTCLDDIDNVQSVPGFIAGLTNPIVEMNSDWWDVLCNLNTGKISLAPSSETNALDENSTLQYAATEADLALNPDVAFIHAIEAEMEQAPNELELRRLCMIYMHRLLLNIEKLESKHDLTQRGPSELPNVQGMRISNGVNTFNDAPTDLAHCQAFRQTKTYQYIRSVWARRQRVLPKTFDNDLIQMTSSQSMPLHKAKHLLESCMSLSNTYSGVLSFLLTLQFLHGGLGVMAQGLFDEEEVIRLHTALLLQAISQYPLAQPFLDSLTPAHSALCD